MWVDSMVHYSPGANLISQNVNQRGSTSTYTHVPDVFASASQRPVPRFASRCTCPVYDHSCLCTQTLARLEGKGVPHCALEFMPTINVTWRVWIYILRWNRDV